MKKVFEIKVQKSLVSFTQNVKTSSLSMTGGDSCWDITVAKDLTPKLTLG